MVQDRLQITGLIGIEQEPARCLPAFSDTGEGDTVRGNRSVNPFEISDIVFRLFQQVGEIGLRKSGFVCNHRASQVDL
jgi:hypothetical protein